MGEIQNRPLQLFFNASLRVNFQGSRVTSDGGLSLVRELDERLGCGDLIAQHLTDSRRGKNTQLPLANLFRRSVYSRIAGCEDVNDAERLQMEAVGSTFACGQEAKTVILVYTEMVVHSAPEAFLRDAPYQIAIVARDDLGRATGRIVGDRVAIGDAVEPVESRDGIPYFRKVPSEAR